MPRKLYKTQEKKNKEKKDIISFAEKNYSYYILLRSIRGFLDSTTLYLKLKNQIERDGKVSKINNEIIDFCHREWLDVINRFLKFIIKKYPTFDKDFDFRVMDKNPKIVEVTTLTVRLHTNDYKFKYGNCAKNESQEVVGAINFLFDILGRIDTITECVNSKKLDIDLNEKKNIKTIVTKFNKYLRPTIMEILEERWKKTK